MTGIHSLRCGSEQEQEVGSGPCRLVLGERCHAWKLWTAEPRQGRVQRPNDTRQGPGSPAVQSHALQSVQSPGEISQHLSDAVVTGALGHKNTGATPSESEAKVVVRNVKEGGGSLGRLPSMGPVHGEL